MRRPSLPDVASLVGIALLLVALALPWTMTRSCPLFEECGPWQTEHGFEGAAIVTGAFGVAAASVLLFVNKALPSRMLAFTFLLLGCPFLMFQGFMQDFVIFGEVQGPFVGYALAIAGNGVGLLGALFGVLWDEARREVPSQTP